MIEFKQGTFSSEDKKKLGKLFGELGAKVKHSDINWSHPKLKKAMQDHEKFVRFMGWRK